MKKLFGIFLAMIIISCSESYSILEISDSKRLIPEGITINEKTGKIYLSSIHQKKVIEYDQNTNEYTDIIGHNEYGYKRGIGITIKDNKLFALGSEYVNEVASSILLVMDLGNKELINSFKLNVNTDHFFNDLTINKENKIFITDTWENSIYTLDYPAGKIELFLRNEELSHPNGITISGDGEKLFVGSKQNGIRIIDIKTKQILNKKDTLTAMKNVDGLKYHNGKLFALFNGSNNSTEQGLVEVILDKTETRIEGVLPILINHPLMDFPTTFCVTDSHIYILANSQLRNLDQDKNEIKDASKLSNTIIIQLNIP